MRFSLATKLVLALASAGLLLFLFFSLWFVPRSREHFLQRSTEVIRASGDAMREGAQRDVAQSREILVSLIEHTSEQHARRLEDLPTEVYAGDVERFRQAVVDADARRRPRLESNAEVLAEEMESRARRRIEARVSELEAEQALASQEFARQQRRTTWIALGVTVVLLLLVLGVALFRAVLAPLGRLRQATARVAAGELSTSLRSTSTDEVGRLSADFEVMVQRLRASQQVQEEKIASLETLAGGVAHEFNNLIGGIGGTASQALAEGADEELRRASLDIIRRAAARGAELTAQLRRYSRAARPIFQQVDLARVVLDAVALLAPEAEGRGVRFRFEGPERCELEADGDGLHQVFLNLLRNAAQAMPDGGEVVVELACGADRVSVEVRDQGVGIPEDVLGRVFDPFFTTKLAAVDAYERGSGLGLSVSYGVVKAHDGTLEVESVVGSGSTFRMQLPSTRPQVPAREVPAAHGER